MATSNVVFGDWRYKVSDLSAAKEFYSRCFGVAPYFDEPTWVVFGIQNYNLWLEPDTLTIESVYESTHPFYKPSNPVRLNFWQVEDVKVVCDRFKALGGTILKAPGKHGPFTAAVVKDPWSNTLGLHSNLS